MIRYNVELHIHKTDPDDGETERVLFMVVRGFNSRGSAEKRCRAIHSFSLELDKKKAKP